MAQPVLLPKLGQTVEEAAIVKWHKKEGDVVSKGDVLFEIETDKAVLEAESFFDGSLLKVLVPEDKVVPVQSVVAYIGEPGEKVPDSPPPPPSAAQPAPPAAAPEKPAKAAEPAAKPAPAAPEKPAPAPKPAIAPQPVAAPSPAPVAQRLFISPRAKALARTSVIDPSRIAGSGPNGRIVVKDVRAYLADHNYDAIRISPAAKRLASNESVDILTIAGTGIGGRIMVADVQREIDARPRTLTKMRQIIANRLTQSFTTTPHFYVTVSVDMTDLFVYRQELKDQGKSYSVTAFIMEAVILSIEEMPVINSVCDGNTIRWHKNVELGMAVGLDEGLVVPVIRSAQNLDMQELHDQIKDLAGRARDGKLMPDEMIGSSFTVSNMGMFDVDTFHAIINPGEGAILAVASTKDEVVVIEGEMKIRSIMKITLSVDHRIVDGTVAATFTNAVKAKLEDVELWKTLT